MPTPTDEASAPDEPPPARRDARTLRSEQDIRLHHTPEAAEYLIAVRRLIVARFGEKSPLQQLAERIREEVKATDPTRKTRAIAQRLSEQLAARAVRGPTWSAVEDVLRHCVNDADRETERERLHTLYKAARGHAAPRTVASGPTPAAGDTDEIIRLRAAVQRAEQERDQKQIRLDVLAEDLATALRAAGTLTTRATEQEQQLLAATQLIKALQSEMQQLRKRYDDARSLNVRNEAELNETREKFARMVAFVESRPEFRNARVTTNALTSTAQSTGISPVSTADGPLRSIAAYLRVHAELSRRQIDDIAEATHFSPEVIERTLAAQHLPSYPVIAMIGTVLGTDPDYLRQAYMQANPEPRLVRQLLTGPETVDITTFGEIVRHLKAPEPTNPEPADHHAGAPPMQQRPNWLDDEPPANPSEATRHPTPPEQQTTDGRWWRLPPTPPAPRRYKGRRRREPGDES